MRCPFWWAKASESPRSLRLWKPSPFNNVHSILAKRSAILYHCHQNFANDFGKTIRFAKTIRMPGRHHTSGGTVRSSTVGQHAHFRHPISEKVWPAHDDVGKQAMMPKSIGLIIYSLIDFSHFQSTSANDTLTCFRSQSVQLCTCQHDRSCSASLRIAQSQVRTSFHSPLRKLLIWEKTFGTILGMQSPFWSQKRQRIKQSFHQRKK